MKLSKSDLYYILGFGFNGFENRDGKIYLSKGPMQRELMEDLCFEITGQIPTRNSKRNFEFAIEGEAAAFMHEHGVFTPKRYLPSMSEEHAWSFIAGYFDANGEISFKFDNPRIQVHSELPEVLDFIAKYWGVKNEYSFRVIANGYKALDICGYMYEKTKFHHAVKWETYLNLLNFMPDKPNVAKNKAFEYAKLHPSAMDPYKKRVTDSGADLYIVELHKEYTTPWGAEVYQGKTHLAIKPVFGYAFDINGRSGLPKSGWTFLQGTGIADRSYTGGIEGTFMKLKDGPLPQLPWRALQMVCRESPLHARYRGVKDLGESDRGTGGFGSTG